MSLRRTDEEEYISGAAAEASPRLPSRWSVTGHKHRGKKRRGSDRLRRGSSRWECSQWRLSLRPISGFYLYLPVFFSCVGVFFSPAGASLWFSFFCFNDSDSAADRDRTNQYLCESFQQKRIPISSFIVFLRLLNNMCLKALMVPPQKKLISTRRPQPTTDHMLRWAESMRRHPSVCENLF